MCEVERNTYETRWVLKISTPALRDSDVKQISNKGHPQRPLIRLTVLRHPKITLTCTLVNRIISKRRNVEI